jgi:MYXO-CTERM domain-containing protein
MRNQRRARTASFTRLTCATAAGLLGLNLRARAADSTWTGPGGGVFSGTFQTAGNWTAGVPGVTNTATFNLNQVYTVTFNASATNATLFLSGSTARVTFNSSGGTRTWTLTNDATFGGGTSILNVLNLAVGDLLDVHAGAQLVASNGSHLDPARLIVGDVGDGAVLVTGAASRLNVSGTVTSHFLGRSGNDGRLTLQNAASGTIAGTIGIAESGTAASTGTLELQSGAHLTLGNVRISPSGLTNQAGVLLLSGSNTAATMTGASTLLLSNPNAVASSDALLQVDNQATFTTGTGDTTVHREGRVLINNGQFNANGNVIVNGGLFQQSLGSPSIGVAPGTTFTASAGAQVTLNNLLLSAATLIAQSAATSITFTQGVTVGGGDVILRDRAIATATNQLTASVFVGGTNTGATGNFRVESGATLFAQDINIGTGATLLNKGVMTVTGNISEVVQVQNANLTIGANLLSTGALNVENLGIFSSGAGNVTVAPLGSITVDSGGIFLGHGNITVAGTLTTTNGGALQMLAGKSLTVTNGGTVTLAGLYTADNTNVSGGTLTVANPSTTSSFTVSAGSLIAGVPFTTNDLNLSGGTVGGSADITVGGTLNWTGGSFAGSGTVHVTNAASFSGATKGILGTRVLETAAGVNWTGGAITMDPGASIHNLATGVFLVNAPLTGGTFNNNGVFQKTGIGALVVGSAFNNAGTVQVNAGSLQFNIGSGGTHTGSFTGSAGTTLQFNGASHTFQPSSTISVPNLNFGNGTINLSGKVTATANFTVGSGANVTAQPGSRFDLLSAQLSVIGGGGAFHLNSGTTFTAAGLSFTNGTIDGGDDIVINGSATWAAGTLGGSGTATLNFSSDFSGTNARTLAGTRNLVLKAPVDWDAGDINLDPAAKINVSNTASLNIFGDFNLVGGALINAGQLTKGFGTGTAFLATETFKNSGTVTVTTGTLLMDGSGTHSGRFTGAMGAVLSFQGFGHVFTPTSVITGSASASFLANNVDVHGTFSPAVTHLLGGNLNLHQAASTGAFLFEGGALGGSNAATFTITNGIHIFGTDFDKTFAAPRTINHAGFGTWTEGHVIAVTGVNFVNSGTFTASANHSWLGGTFTNNGLFIRTGDTNQLTAFLGGAFNNNGTVRVDAGDLVLQSDGNHTGVFTGSAGGNLRLAGGGNHTFTASSRITGSNNVLLEDGIRTFDGTYNAFRTRAFSGFSDFSTSPTTQILEMTGGTIRLMPSVTPGGRVLRTTQFSASGPAALDLFNNGMILDYAPGNATAVATIRGAIINAFIRSSNASGDPSKAIGYAEAAEIFNLSGTATATFLGQTVDASAVLARFTLAGDANLDGQVNFNDLVLLAQHYNTTVSATTDSWWFNGDFTNDGVVNFNDLVKLAQNYNTVLAAQPIPAAPPGFEQDLARALASVPEPAAFPLLGLAALLARRRRRQAVSVVTSGPLDHAR